MKTITAVPRALQPWRAWLEWFREPSAKAVGALANGLLPLMTPMRGAFQSGQAEPDGFDDLRRRGAYERLLTSEWLLAGELPDEFLRRAVSAEHLFLNTRPRAQRLRRRLLVLFDASPWQLGAPRLVHLALWILLARRAEMAGVELCWGRLQAPGALYPALTATDLKMLLEMRSWICVDSEHETGWAQWIDENKASLAECWHVGSAASAAAMSAVHFSHSIRIARSVDESALDVVLDNRVSQRSVRLELPPSAVAKTLLGGHFGGDTQPSVVAKSTADLSDRFAPVFSHNGRMVAVAARALNGISAFQVPRRQESIKPVQYQWSRTAEAIGIVFNDGHAGAVLRDGSMLRFWQIKAFRETLMPDSDKFSVPPGTSVWRSCFLIYVNNKPSLFILDAQNRLLYWTPGTSDLSGPHILERNVLAVMQLDRATLLYVYLDQGQLYMRRSIGTLCQARSLPMGSAVPDTRVLLSAHTRRDKQTIFACAVLEDARDAVETWSTYVETITFFNEAERRAHRATLQPGEHAVGLFGHAAINTVSLAVMAPNRRTFHRVGPDGRENLYVAAQPVSRVTVCPISGHMALLTTDHGLTVYALHSRALKLLVQGAET
jgi:hypothetical protein